jgi:hypothetical protein
MQDAKTSNGASPFEDHDCGHLPCPPWIEEGDGAAQTVAVEPQVDPELDPPHHVHDLWAVLGLGED